MKPLIGITPSPVQEEMPHGTFERYAMASTYVDAVLAAGGIPVVLPPQDGNTEDLLDTIDGLLLSGGADLDPALYGDDTVHPTTYGVHALRDRMELDLVAGALQRDLPLLCICRGIQVLNVALGGTLIQDIPDQHPTSIQHRQHEAGLEPSAIGHEVNVVPDTLLERVYDSARVGVNSFHHQAVKELAPDLVAAAYSDDGLVEAVVASNQTFALGVQWHPEMMFKRHAEQLKPFEALVEAAVARRLAVVSI